MGFPTWTLIGMGITFVGAFVMVILAYIAMSPGFAARIGLGGTRIAYQVKTFTGYALALLLLFLGFFLAGVPLDPALVATAVPTQTPAAITEADSVAPLTENPTATETAFDAALEFTPTVEPDTAQTPASGAFGGPPPDQDGTNESADSTNSAGAAPSIEASTADGSSVVVSNTPTPVTFTPTPTNSPTPTATPTPTVTPTPIDGETAVLDLGGSVIWLRRSPGGQNLVVLQDRELVILHAGRANRAGLFWREVSTGNGTIGWVEEQFLQLNEN